MLDIQSVCNNLNLGQDGIWYSKDHEDISYPTGGNETCFTVEEKSFWFMHRNNCILSVVNSYPPKNNGTIFDIGGGNGFVSSALAASGFNVALVEPGIIGALNAKHRGLDTVICATPATAQFKSCSLSAIGLFDVLEHIEDDLSFLKSLKNLMKDQGRIYITVPAYSFLWSGRDVFAGHYRRYTRKSICKVVECAGFNVEFSSYIFRFLPIPIALFRALPYRMGLSPSKDRTKTVARDHVAKGRATASILDFILSLEVENLANNKTMRFGGSCLIVAKSSSLP